MAIEGGCFCGAVRYRIDAAPDRVTHCHCLHCRRTSGAPFLTWVEFDPERFAWIQGEPGRCASRPPVTRCFCRDCGTQLTFQDGEGDSRCIDVTAASLDDPDQVEPQDHVWADRMLPWLRFDDGLPRYALDRHGKR